MRIKRLIPLFLALILVLPCLNSLAEVQYFTNIQVNAVALDKPTPSPVPTATPRPTPEPTQTPVPTATPAPTLTPGPDSYEIEVDLANQIVTVFKKGSREEADIVRQMICSSGIDTKTPVGTFTMPDLQKLHEREEWYFIGKFRLYVQYASRIVNDILFHSLPSVQRGVTPTQDSTEALGQRASHGCIRLRPSDSRWIAENCPPGTEVSIFEGAKPAEELRQKLLITSFVSEEMSYADFLAGEKVYSISSNSAEVQYMQAKLAELGYLMGESDGIFGAETHAAVVEWQTDNGHAPTGEVNEEQLAALLRQVGNPADAAAHGKSARVRVSDALILRSEPNSKSRELDVLKDGTAVRVLEETRSWYKIRIGSQTGYVAKKYIEITANNTEGN